MTTQTTSEGKKPTLTRIYVGGLGERVTEEDLRKTFSNLGSLESIDIIRNKGRSFAYINFVPSSDNSLPKLLSTYNGCTWKGGKLKLEKAKIHYMDRLKREWAEDAKAKVNAHAHADADKDIVTSPKLKSSSDLEKMQIRVYFPKLRTVKSLPLRGTGKHKYSFQRIEVPPLPVHFCDCPEHSDLREIPKVSKAHSSVMNRFSGKGSSHGSESLQLLKNKPLQDSKIQDEGMNKEEISMMNSVMKKVLDKETTKIDRKEVQDPIEENNPTSDLLANENEIEDGTDDDDDDDIQINVVSKKNNALFSDNWELPTSLVNKRKIVSNESDERDRTSPIIKKKACMQTPSNEPEKQVAKLNVSSETGTKTSSVQKGACSQKMSWKELVGAGINSSFSLSHITPCGESNNEECARHGTETSSESEELGNETSSESEELGVETSFENEEHDNETLDGSEEDGNETSSESEELGIETSSESQKLDNETSSENDELDNEISSESEDAEELDNETSPESEEHGNETLSENEEPGNETSSEGEELGMETLSEPKKHDKAKNVIHDKLDVQLSQSSKKDEALANKPTMGSTWMQKSSWTQLVGSGNSSGFSISQILPQDSLGKRDIQKPNTSSNMGCNSIGVAIKEPRTSTAALNVSQCSKFGLTASNKKRDNEVSAPKDNVPSSVPNKKPKLELKPMSSNSIPEVGVGTSCPFVRSSDSLKEWKSAKTTLSSALKRKNNKK